MTPVKLARIDQHLSKLCWKCHNNEGTMYHAWWGCTMVKKYWLMIAEAIAEVLGYNLTKIPEIYILGLKMEEFKPEDRTIIWYMLAAARILLAKYWKSEKTPELFEWKAKLIYMADVDKLTKKLRGCSKSKYMQEWSKWTKYCNKDPDFQQFTLNMEIY